MKVFERYPESVLREVSRDVRHDTFLANETREFCHVDVCYSVSLRASMSPFNCSVKDLSACIHVIVHVFPPHTLSPPLSLFPLLSPSLSHIDTIILFLTINLLFSVLKCACVCVV